MKWDDETLSIPPELFKLIEKSPLQSNRGPFGCYWPSWGATGYQGSYLAIKPGRTVRWRGPGGDQWIKPEQYESVVEAITHEYLVAMLKGGGG